MFKLAVNIFALLHSLSPCWSIFSSWAFLAFTSLYFTCRVEKKDQKWHLPMQKDKMWITIWVWFQKWQLLFNQSWSILESVTNIILDSLYNLRKITLHAFHTFQVHKRLVYAFSFLCFIHHTLSCLRNTPSDVLIFLGIL